MGRALRAQRRAIKRRVYNVPCPNALWYVFFINSLKTSNNSLKWRCKTVVRPARGYGEQGNLPFLFNGNMGGHLAYFLENKGSKDHFSRNWGTFSVSF